MDKDCNCNHAGLCRDPSCVSAQFEVRELCLLPLFSVFLLSSSRRENGQQKEPEGRMGSYGCVVNSLP